MAWFYNSYSGELTQASGFDALAYEAAIHTGTGWHQLKISASATEAQAAAEARKEDPKGTAPTTSIGTGTGNAVVSNPVTGAVTNALGLPQLSNLRDLMSRAVRVVLGALLIIIGANSLLHGQGITLPRMPVPV